MENKQKHNFKFQYKPDVFFSTKPCCELTLCVWLCFRFCPATMIPRRSWATTWTLRYSPAKCAWCLTVSTGARCACGWSCEGAPLTVSTYMFNILHHFYTSSHTCHVCMFIVPFSWREETLGNPLYSISRRKKSCFPTLSGKMTSKAGREQPLFFLFGCRRWLILAVCVARSNPPVLPPTFGENVAKALSLFSLCAYFACVHLSRQVSFECSRSHSEEEWFN